MMRKVLTFGIATLALVAFTAGSSNACGVKDKSTASATKTVDGKLASSTTDGKLASSSKACSLAKNASLASGHKSCAGYTSSAKKASYAYLPAKAQLVASSHEANCSPGGKCELVNISVNGMTCGGCETGVKNALVKVAGVNGVVNVNYSEGIAQVCVKKGADQAALTKAVSSTGFESNIILAVAKTSTVSKTTKANAEKSYKSCSALKGEAKTVSAKKAAAKKTDEKGDTY